METFILKWFSCVIRTLRRLSLFGILEATLPSRILGAGFSDAWVLAHLLVAGLVSLCIGANSASLLAWLVVVYGWLRIYELVVYQIDVVLVAPAASPDFELVSLWRSMLLAVLNYGEVLLWFAAFYRFSAARFGDKAALVGTVDGSFYYSILTMATYGDINPQDTISRGLVALHLAIALFLTLVVLARFVSLLPRPRSKDSNGKGSA